MQEGATQGEAVAAQERDSSFKRASEIHEFHIMKIEFSIWKDIYISALSTREQALLLTTLDMKVKFETLCRRRRRYRGKVQTLSGWRQP